MSENKVLSDLEIAHHATMLPIEDIAERAGINVDALELYGPYKAKINRAKLVLPPQGKAPPGKVVLVSAMSPTPPAGEGKSTTTVGLADSLARAGHKVMIALREPSLGPILGMKEGGLPAAGTPKCCPWMTSTCTSPGGTSTPSRQRTTPSWHSWTITYSKAINSESIPGA